MTKGVPSLDDFTNALAPINRGLPIWGHLLGLLRDCLVKNVILYNLQSIDVLYFFNQKRPRITGFDGVLMILKII